MDVRRRAVLAGAVASLSGCSRIEGLVRDVARPDTHPLAGETAVAVVDRTESDHDLETLTGEALAFWNQNAEKYAGFAVDFRLGEHPPAVEVVFVDTREELTGCQEYTEGHVLGCAPVLEVGARIDRPVTAEVVATDRPSGEVRITTMHEIGHLLGLGHDDDPAYVMSNRIEDRLPGFEHRVAVLDAYERALERRNAATRRYNEGIAAWNDEEYETAAARFDEAQQGYLAVTEELATAREHARNLEDIERPDTVDLEGLTDHLDRAGRNVELAAEAAGEMAAASRAAADGDVLEARRRRDRANERLEQASEVGFPSPRDVAVSLGLVDEPETTEAEPGSA